MMTMKSILKLRIKSLVGGILFDSHCSLSSRRTDLVPVSNTEDKRTQAPAENHARKIRKGEGMGRTCSTGALLIFPSFNLFPLSKFGFHTCAWLFAEYIGYWYTNRKIYDVNSLTTSAGSLHENV